jgi:hypothetical protein
MENRVGCDVPVTIRTPPRRSSRPRDASPASLRTSPRRSALSAAASACPGRRREGSIPFVPRPAPSVASPPRPLTPGASWRASGDPHWNLRWRALGADDRARLTVAGLSRSSTKALLDPEERELAEDFGRHERWRRAYLDLLMLAALTLIAALMLAGAASSSNVGLILAAYAVVRWPGESLRDWQIKRRAGAPAEAESATEP